MRPTGPHPFAAAAAILFICIMFVGCQPTAQMSIKPGKTSIIAQQVRSGPKQTTTTTTKTTLSPPAETPDPKEKPTVYTVRDQPVTVPPGTVVVVEQTVTTTNDRGDETIDITGTATGPSADSRGEKIDGKFTGAANEIVLPPFGSVRTGPLDTETQVTGLSTSQYILYGLGGVVILGAGLIYVVTGNIKPTLIIALCGLAIIAAGVIAEKYPWAYLLAIVGAVGAAAYFVWREWSAGRDRQVIGVLAKGVERAPNGSAVEVKTSIKNAAEDANILATVKKRINAIKLEKNL